MRESYARSANQPVACFFFPYAEGFKHRVGSVLERGNDEAQEMMLGSVVEGLVKVIRENGLENENIYPPQFSENGMLFGCTTKLASHIFVSDALKEIFEMPCFASPKIALGYVKEQEMNLRAYNMPVSDKGQGVPASKLGLN
ncbi:MAG: hypothetical protein H6868_04740 [Rhodospirillales bacterium]|nr:hypothetical protein [Rhodospirillales bacterium]